MSAAATVAAVSALSWVDLFVSPRAMGSKPMLVALISPRIRFLALVAGELPFPAFLAACLARATVAHAAWFSLGAQSRDAQLPGRLAARGHRRAASLLEGSGTRLRGWVWVLPNNAVSFVAGARRMHPGSFSLHSTLATSSRLALLWVVAGSLEPGVAPIRELVDRWSFAVTAIGIGGGLAVALLGRRRLGRLEVIDEGGSIGDGRRGDE